MVAAAAAARHLHHRLRSDVGVQLLDVVVEVEVDEEVGLEPLEVAEARRVPRLVEVGEQLAHLSRVWGWRLKGGERARWRQGDGKATALTSGTSSRKARNGELSMSFDLSSARSYEASAQSPP